jgi:aryl-alcohol dehydrogenase-like predicted oxidoreductase
MLYRTLGRTGIQVSPYALGALALGTPRLTGRYGRAGGRPQARPARTRPVS